MKKYVVFVLAVILLGIIASCSYALDIFKINAPRLSDATVGEYASYTFTVTDLGGNSTAGVKWGMNGSIPGMSFLSGRLSGRPTQAGLYQFTVTAERYYSTNYTPASDSVFCSLIVAEKGDDNNGGDNNGGGNDGAELIMGEVSSIILAGINPTVGDEYPMALYGEIYGKVTVDGGTPPYTWSVTKGTLPKGLCLASSSTGLGYQNNQHTGPYVVLSGVMAQGGTYSFTLKVEDSAGQSAEKDVTIEVSGGNIDELEINGELVGATARLVVGTYDTYLFDLYSENFVYVSGGRAPYTFTKSGGELPSGVKISTDGNHAEFSGKPERGKYSFVLKVTDADGRTAQKGFTVVYSNSNEKDNDVPEYGSETDTEAIPEITGEFSEAAEGESYSGYVSVSGGTAPYTWSLSNGDLPPGMSLTCSNSESSIGTGNTGNYAHVSGTATQAGFYNFALKVTDTSGKTTAKTFSVKAAWKADPEPDNPEPDNPEPDNPEPDNPEPNNPEPDNPEPDNPEPDNPEPDNPEQDNSTDNDNRNDNSTRNKVSSSSGGGCDSGISVLSLAVLAVFTLTRRK